MNRHIYRFAIGLGAGVGLGLLLAPRSGRKTRLLIQEKASDGAAYLRQRGSDVRDAAADAIRDGARRVSRGTEAVRAAVETGKQAYHKALQS